MQIKSIFLMLATFLFFCFSSSFSSEEDPSEDPCEIIVKTLAPRPKWWRSFRITGYAQSGFNDKDIGIKVEVPFSIFDERERYEKQKRYWERLKFVTDMLYQYLALKTEIEETQKYIQWQWERVKHGIEYKKDVWPLEIKLLMKKEKLRALVLFFKSVGIEEELLEKCWGYKSKK